VGLTIPHARKTQPRPGGAFFVSRNFPGSRAVNRADSHPLDGRMAQVGSMEGDETSLVLPESARHAEFQHKSRRQLSRQKILHLMESFLKASHVVPRKNVCSSAFFARTDGELDPRPGTHREMRDVGGFRLHH
jgi:hypothetical protein